MKYIILLIVPFVIACGAAPLVAVSAVVVMPTPSNASPSPKNNLTETTLTAQPTRLPQFVETAVIGCWNIRTSPADLRGENIIRVQCGGSVTVKQWAANGYIELAGGEYVCNQAIGTDETCR